MSSFKQKYIKIFFNSFESSSSDSSWVIVSFAREMLNEPVKGNELVVGIEFVLEIGLHEVNLSNEKLESLKALKYELEQ